MNVFFKTLLASLFRHQKREVFLILSVITLGVTGFSAILTLNDLILKQFEQTVSKLTSAETVALWSDSDKIPAHIYFDLKKNPKIQAIVPVIKSRALIQNQDRGVNVEFLDFIELGYTTNQERPESSSFDSLKNPFESPKYVFASAALWQKIKSNPKLSLIFMGQKWDIEAISKVPHTGGVDHTIYVDIRHLKSFGIPSDVLTRLEIKASNDVLESIQKSLPADLHLGETNRRLEQGQVMIRSFQINLLCLSLVNVLVGFFMIYLGLNLAFHRRRKEFALLQSLGAQRQKLALYLISEALLFSTIASLLGFGLGQIVSAGLLDTLSQNVSTLYFPVTAAFEFSHKSFWGSLLLGWGATLFAALHPVWDLKNLSLTDFLRPAANEIAFQKTPRLLFGFAILSLAFALTTHHFTNFKTPEWSLLTSLFVTLIPIFLAPILLEKISHFFIVCLPPYSILKLGDLRNALFRYSQLTATLVVAFSLSFAIIGMTASFRTTVEDWLTDQFSADIFISPSDRRINPFNTKLPSELVKKLQSDPRLQSSYTFEGHRLPFQNKVVDLFLTDTASYFRFKKISSAAKNGHSELHVPISASENFLLRHGLQVGDPLSLKFENQNHNFFIQNSFRDYTSENGVLVADFKSLNLNRVQHDHVLHIFLKNPADTKMVLKDFNTLISGRAIDVLSHTKLRHMVIKMFDDTFILARALQWLSFGVAFASLTINISLILREKIRADSVLRALGLDSNSWFKIYFFENLILITTVILLSILGAAILLWVLIFAVQKYFFSWLMGYQFPVFPIINTLIFLMISIWVLGLNFQKKLFKDFPVTGLRHE